jgi:LytS/YehU family sensor histidine kinase
VQPEARSALVPALILQPLVENAIEHGVARRRAGGRVQIDTRIDGDALLVAVRDDGPGPGAPNPGGLEMHLGLVKSRAEVFDAAANQLRIEVGGSGMVAGFEFSEGGGPARAVTVAGTRFDRVER